MNTPDCQSTNGSGAPNGSSPGSSRPWVVDPASISATVLGQSQTAQSSRTRAVEASLHLAFGLGSGWTLVDATSIETARMGQTQPEKLALATVLSGWATIANVLVVPIFYYLQRRLSWRIERWVWVGLLLQLSSAVLAALSWHVTLGRTSPCLYAVAFLSCIGGNFQQLAVVPWLQEGTARPACVSWTMAGSNLGAMVCAVFGAIQQPGHHSADGQLDQRFTVGTFFAVVALVVLVGIGAFALLLRRRRAEMAAPSSAEHAGHTPSQDGTTSRLDVEQNDLILRRQSSSSGCCGCCARRCSEGWCRRSRRLPWCAPPPHALQPCCDSGCSTTHERLATLQCHRACRRLPPLLCERLPCCVPEAATPGGRPCCGRYAKEPHVLRISGANAYVQLVCWVFIRSLLPYAAAHAMGSNSSTAAAHEAHESGAAGELQGYAVEASMLAVFVGALASAFLPNRALRLGPTYCAMLLPLTLLTAMALGWPLGSQAAAATLLLVAVVVARATDGLVSPLLYRVAGDPYPETERQAVTQWVGIVAILTAAVGSGGALCLVLTGVVE